MLYIKIYMYNRIQEHCRQFYICLGLHVPDDFQNCYNKPYFINKKLKIINLKRPG